MHRAQKLTQDEWLEIEVDLTDFEQRICSLMLQSGSIFSSLSPSDHKLNLEVLGEPLYTELFQEKIKKMFFPEENPDEESKKTKKHDKGEKAKKAGKPGSKNAKKGKNDIYEKYMKTEKRKKVEEQFLDILKASADSLFRQRNFGFSSNILEFKLISFMVLAKLVKDREEWIYEIIIGLKKCLQSYESFKGKVHFSEIEGDVEALVSESLIKEIKLFMENLMEMNVFSMKITFIRYPKLVYHTNFDSYFESIQLKPYDSQKELLRGLKNFYLDRTNEEKNQGLLVFYKAMIGSGKTTVSLALAAMVTQLRVEKPKQFKNLQVIFCCGLTQIRVQVGQLAFNSLKFDKLTFAVLTSLENETIITRNHFSCRDAKNPVLLISDLETTVLLLQQRTNQNYILFLDEPIIDADQLTSPITDAFIQIMKNAPNLTILSSATLPNPENLPNLVGNFRKKYENSEIFTIFSEQAKVAQQIYVNFSDKYYPHNGCKNAEELGKVLSSVRSNPFLARLYTGPSLYHFEDKLKKMGISKILSKGVEDKFSDPRNMNQKYVQEYAFELLEALLENGDDAKIDEFCLEEKEKGGFENYKKRQAEEEEEPGLIEKESSLLENNKEKEEDIINEKEEIIGKEEIMEEIIPKNKEEMNQIELKKQSSSLKSSRLKWKWEELATKKAHLFVGGCLIATPKPFEFARKAFGQFVSKVTLKGLMKDFDKQQEVYEAELKKFEEIKNEEERLKKRTIYENENTPKIQFPDYMKINLKAHLLKYSDLEKPELVGYRKDFLIEKLVFNIEEDLNLMLFSGVGVFESDRIFNEEYNKTIRNKAKFGELAYLISNKDILYGANYPLNNVIIQDSFVKLYSINTIFQTMGRAGRIGQAWKSNCFIGENIKKKLNEFIQESNKPDFISIEAQNIEKKITDKFFDMRIGGDIVAKMRKIAIFFDNTCLDGMFSMMSAVFFYMHKLQKSYKQHMSDVDFFQIVKLVPLDNLETVDELEHVTTAYFLGVFPLKSNEKIQKAFGDCRKIVYIDHREFNREKYIDFMKESDMQAIKTKFIEVFENGATAQIALKYFKEKAKKKQFITDYFNPIFPNYVKKSHNQALSPQVFEAFIKLISEAEMSYELKSAEIMSCLTEKVLGYLSSCGKSLKMIWKIATLKIEVIKAKSVLKHSNVLIKCNVLIDELIRNVQISRDEENLTCMGLYKVPVSYYKFRNLIKELVMAKTISMNVKRICVISWISYKNKEKLVISVHSNEISFNCEEFAKKFGGIGGKKDAEFKMNRKEFDLWKFTQIMK